MAELIETQEELFDAADINKADEPQVEQTQEPVAQEVSEEDLPPKYKGKSLDEIVRMHQEAEKLIGRQAQELARVPDRSESGETPAMTSDVDFVTL